MKEDIAVNTISYAIIKLKTSKSTENSLLNTEILASLILSSISQLGYFYGEGIYLSLVRTLNEKRL